MINKFYERFIKIEIFKSSDGQGGFETIPVEVLNFKAGLTSSKSVSKLIGEQYSVLNTYTLLLPLEVELNLGDIVKREENNNFYEVINDPGDYKTPLASSVKFKQALVKRYILPKGVV